MEASIPSAEHIQEAERVSGLRKELAHRAQNRFDLFVELKDPVAIPDSLRQEFTPLLDVMSRLRAQPEFFLERDQPKMNPQTREWVLPDWLHRFAQVTGTSEEISRRGSSELASQSWFAQARPIDATTLKQLFSIKDSFRQRVAFEQSGTATVPPKAEFTPAEVVGLLSDTIKEQIFWDVGLERAKEVIQIHLPEMTVRSEVRSIAYAMPVETGLYFGAIADRHYIGGSIRNTQTLADLAEGKSDLFLHELTSIIVHELVHAKQAEIQEEKFLTKEQQNRFFAFYPRTQASYFKHFTQMQKPADDPAIIEELRESARRRVKFQGRGREVPMAIVEGGALVAQHYVISKMIEQETSVPKKQALRSVKLDLRKSTFCDAAVQATPFYLQGVKIFVPIYREFGVQILPELFRQMDVDSLLLEPDPEFALEEFAEDPRIIPGLFRIPEVEESLRKRPPNGMNP